MSKLVRSLTTEEFDRDVLRAPGLHLVDFGAPWCAPCRVIEKTVDTIAAEHAGHVTVSAVNVDDEPVLAARYDVRSLPTLLFFRNGEVVDAIYGAVPKRVIDEKIEPWRGGAAPRSR
jgi:thioredoxin 1